MQGFSATDPIFLALARFKEHCFLEYSPYFYRFRRFSNYSVRIKIDEIENIVHSSDRKAKKWENAKNIIKWIADKGVDVGITLLPLLLQIK